METVKDINIILLHQYLDEASKVKLCNVNLMQLI